MHPLDQHPRNRHQKRLRSDVLDLYSSCTQRTGKNVEASIRQLAAMGYRETHPTPNHWVLSRAGVKVHLYSEQELKAFAVHVGVSDAETCTDTLAHRTPEEIS